jgi:hypothetical protein
MDRRGPGAAVGDFHEHAGGLVRQPEPHRERDGCAEPPRRLDRVGDKLGHHQLNRVGRIAADGPFVQDVTGMPAGTRDGVQHRAQFQAGAPLAALLIVEGSAAAGARP